MSVLRLRVRTAHVPAVESASRFPKHELANEDLRAVPFLLGTETMSIPNHLRSLYLFLIALFVLAVAAIPLSMLSESYSKRQSLVSRQQAVIETIWRRGGFVVYRPFSNSDLPDVISLDLSNAMVDAELMQTLGQFTGSAAADVIRTRIVQQYRK